MSPVPSAGFTPLSFLSTKGSSPSHDDDGGGGGEDGDDDDGGGNHNNDDYGHETVICIEQHSNRSFTFWYF